MSACQLNQGCIKVNYNYLKYITYCCERDMVETKQNEMESIMSVVELYFI